MLRGNRRIRMATKVEKNSHLLKNSHPDPLHGVKLTHTWICKAHRPNMLQLRKVWNFMQ